MKPNKRSLWIAAGLVAAGGLTAGYRYREAGTRNALHYDIVKVDRGRITAKVTATGTLSAIVTVQVGSQVSGRLQAIYVDYNSPVKKNQLIAKIDPALFQAADAQARANEVAARGNLVKAQAQAADADRQYQRNKQLATQGLVDQADLETSMANADAARAQVEASKGAVAQAEASLNQAKINLAYTDIYSPTDGTVISRSVDVGQTVAASLQAPTLFVIAQDLRKMQVDTSVAEADIGGLHDGMPATFTVDAYPGQAFTGKVRQIRNAPQTVQNVVTYDAVVDIDNPELKLKPGMTANVTFVAAQRDDVLRVPNAALRFHPTPDVLAAAGFTGSGTNRRPAAAAGTPQAGAAQGGSAGWQRDDSNSNRRRVWVLESGRPRPVAVQTGVSDGSLTEVAGGKLAEGAQVITDVSGGRAASAAPAPSNQQPGGVARRLF
ncbi:MAG TPA: efflux RND transporter periplasmic adaptor subunit [Vicinamibacteria bacterium]|nr:efflux RND transporter periplasmic adaptor subunit [Vicinamibacteria bacterium]